MVTGSYMHPDTVTKEDSESLVAGNPDGTFLVRARPDFDGEFVLVVVYRGKPTQHLMKKVCSPL